MGIDIGKFFRFAFLIAGLIWLLISYPLFKFASVGFIKSFVVGFLISVANLVIGMMFLKIGYDRPNKEFLRLALGSMGIRLVAIAVVVSVLLKVLGFDPYGLILSLLFFYFVFLALEVIFLSKMTTKKRF